MFAWPAVSATLPCKGEHTKTIWHTRYRGGFSIAERRSREWTEATFFEDCPCQQRSCLKGSLDELSGRKAFREGALDVLFVDESSDKQDWNRFIDRILRSLEQASTMVDYRQSSQLEETEADFAQLYTTRNMFTNRCPYWPLLDTLYLLPGPGFSTVVDSILSSRLAESQRVLSPAE